MWKAESYSVRLRRAQGTDSDDGDHALNILFMLRNVHRLLKRGSGVFLCVSMHRPAETEIYFRVDSRNSTPGTYVYEYTVAACSEAEPGESAPRVGRGAESRSTLDILVQSWRHEILPSARRYRSELARASLGARRGGSSDLLEMK